MIDIFIYLYKITSSPIYLSGLLKPYRGEYLWAQKCPEPYPYFRKKHEQHYNRSSRRRAVTLTTHARKMY